MTHFSRPANSRHQVSTRGRGVGRKEFARRRRQLMEMMEGRSIAIIPSASMRIRNRDAEYPFRQDSDFLYLTGFNEPDSVAILMPGREHGEYLLFCRERDPEQETWHGRRAGLEGAIKRHGANDSFPFSDLEDIVPGLLENCDRIYYTMGIEESFDRRLIGWVTQVRSQARKGVHAPREFVSLDYLLHDMRLFKSKREIEAMRLAALHSAEAHSHAMSQCRPGLHEYQIEAELLYHFRRNGMVPAYTPIVGGGANGCILHYVENSDRLRDGDLLLIDAGGEFDGYAADITRTFPVNGRFTTCQRELYEVVLEAQKAAIDAVRPGNHWEDPHVAAVTTITRGLRNLGLLRGDPAKLVREEKYKSFYMHRTGHWLGLDVHDVGDYKIDGEWRLLEPGMVLTVEPGIYIAAGTRGVRDRKWWNTGIRIEDDVVVTGEGCEVLTGGVPREPEAIEKLVGSAVREG